MISTSINPVRVHPYYSPNNKSLVEKLSEAKEFLTKNSFPDLDFSVHDKHGITPTIVLVGRYESSQDLDLYTLLDSKEFKNILPESISVEWMHREEESPDQTILETYPDSW